MNRDFPGYRKAGGDFHYLSYLLGETLVTAAAGERMRGVTVPLVGWC